MESTQVAIIGAGPIGLELAIALQRAGIDYLQFDAGQIGQTISWYPRQVRFFSSPERIAIAGVPFNTPDQSKGTREEYLAYLRSVVEMFGLKINTFERVIAITRAPTPGSADEDARKAGEVACENTQGTLGSGGADARGRSTLLTPGKPSRLTSGITGESDRPFTLRTHHGGIEKEYEARYVVLAVGDMHRPRNLHIPGEDLPHVSHYFEEPHVYFQKRLLIVGGRNSAVETAIRCYRTGARVTLSYRGDAFDEQAIKYWLLPEVRWLIKTGKIEFCPLTVPRRITPSHVLLEPVNGSAKREVAADFVLLLTGYVMDTALFEMAGVELEGENRAPVCDPQTMETNVPGLFVAGTAAAGSQVRFRLFIENCHIHAQRIVAAITGRPAPAVPEGPGAPES